MSFLFHFEIQTYNKIYSKSPRVLSTYDFRLHKDYCPFHPFYFLVHYVPPEILKQHYHEWHSESYIYAGNLHIIPV